ncbi:helix-turn-helix domain-containing protein [Actinomyces gaoshouyii]|uniref:helix-turn-helix domain-containing protein n=1 Tax=Actinomyces gaoshouyii TaxID=1960083 RepID=UPI00196ABD1A|nr:helix-turn-helix domain-containing protein [Actinomyces gaoshouyii]
MRWRTPWGGGDAQALGGLGDAAIYTGRARALSEADIERARARVAAGVPKAHVARDLGVHRSTLHRALSRQAE